MQVLELLSVESPIRQGDVVSYSSEASGPYGSKTAVVLTADCDLAQSKHYGQLLLCPIVPIGVLLKGPWAMRRARRLMSSTEQKVRQELEKLLSECEGGLSESTVASLIASAEAMEAGLAGLASVPDHVRQRLIRLSRVYCASDCDEAGALKALIEAYAVRDNSTQEVAKGKVLAEFKDEMKGDNVDVVALPDELQGENAACVILLRCPYSVPASDVGLSSASGARLIRVGRLCASVKYLVAQKFGLLFSRFGLPRQIEDDRDMAVEIEEIFV